MAVREAPVRRGWLLRECCTAAQFEQEEIAEAYRRAAKRLAEWDKTHPLGEEEPSIPSWHID